MGITTENIYKNKELKEKFRKCVLLSIEVSKLSIEEYGEVTGSNRGDYLKAYLGGYASFSDFTEVVECILNYHKMETLKELFDWYEEISKNSSLNEKLNFVDLGFRTTDDKVRVEYLDDEYVNISINFNENENIDFKININDISTLQIVLDKIVADKK